MRQILSSMFLIIPFLLFSQTPELKITGTKQDWAGGICCSSGTNYVLSISSNDIDLSEMKLGHINIDGNCISQGWTITNTGKGSATVAFGTSQNRHTNRDIFPDEGEKVHKDHDCGPENSIRLKVKGRQRDVPIGELEELPYIPYP